MKKILTFLIGTLLGFQSICAEKAPLMPRKAANGEYSLVEAERFALDRGVVSNWWRENAIVIINKGLTAYGESMQIDSLNIHWVFEHITYEFKDLGPYTNSRLSDGVPEWFEDKDGWSGTVAVFRYKKCILILYKTQCMNLLNIPVRAPFIQNPPAGKKPDLIDTTKTGNVTVVNNIYLTNTIENSGNSTVSAGPSTPTTGTQYIVGQDDGFRQTSWGGYERPVMPRMNVWQVAASFGFGGNNNYQQPYYQQLPPRNPNDGNGLPIINNQRKRIPNDGNGNRIR